MNDFGALFGMIVAAPAVLFALVAATKHELADFARRSLVVYAAFLIVALGSLFAAAAGNPIVVYMALAFAFLAHMSGGIFSLGISAFGLFVLLLLGMVQSVPFSAWGPGLGLLACLGGLVVAVRTSGYRAPPKR